MWRMAEATEMKSSEDVMNESSMLTFHEPSRLETQDCSVGLEKNDRCQIVEEHLLHTVAFPSRRLNESSEVLVQANSSCDEENPVVSSVDITVVRDGGVMKQILKEGTGEDNPGFGDKVIVHYVGWLLNGKSSTVFDSSRERGEKFEFSLGKGLVIKAWDLGVLTMRRGEVSIFICQPKYAYGEFGSPPTIPPMSILAFEIELFDWKLEDLSLKKDCGILREVIVKGDGMNSPNEGANIIAHITGYYGDDILEDRVVEIVLGEGCLAGVPEGIEIALLKFKNQEKSKLHLKAKYAFGVSGKPEYGIPPNADVVYDVTLLNFEKAKEVWEMDTDEKLQKSLDAKEKGSYYFKAGNLKVAVKQFKRVIKYLEKEPGVSPDEQKPRSILLLSGYLNSALCLLKLENPSEAIKLCEKALEIDPNNEKALFRKGQGLLALNEFEQAVDEFQKALKLYPNNKAIKNSVIFCERRICKHKQKERKTYNNMFKKFAEEDEELWKQMLFQTETGVWGGDISDHCNREELEEMNERNKGESFREIELLNDRNLREIEMLNIHSNRESCSNLAVLIECNKYEKKSKIGVSKNEHTVGIENELSKKHPEQETNQSLNQSENSEILMSNEPNLYELSIENKYSIYEGQAEPDKAIENKSLTDWSALDKPGGLCSLAEQCELFKQQYQNN